MPPLPLLSPRLILFDPDWNPATDLQAAARVRRSTWLAEGVRAGICTWQCMHAGRCTWQCMHVDMRTVRCMHVSKLTVRVSARDLHVANGSHGFVAAERGEGGRGVGSRAAVPCYTLGKSLGSMRAPALADACCAACAGVA